MAAPTRTIIQHRRDTAANWTTNNTVVLAAGELGFETDTNKFKIGDGTKSWSTLDYAPAGITYLTTSGTTSTVLVAKSTNIAGGAAGKVPYQTGAGTTDFTTVGSSGQLLSSNGTGAPTWLLPRLDQLSTTTATQFRSILTGVTGTAGNVVFSGSPTITSPTIVTSATLNGATSGAVTITATDTYTTSVAFPTYSGTLTTEGNVTTNFLSKTSTTAQTMASDVNFQSHALSGITALTATGTVILSGITGLSNTYGVMKAASNGTVSDGNLVQLDATGTNTASSGDVQGTLPLANGGTGGTDVTTARQGFRIYVQSAQPSSANITNYSPQVGDLWFW